MIKYTTKNSNKSTKKFAGKIIALGLVGIMIGTLLAGCGDKIVDNSNKSYADMKKYFKLSEYADGDNTVAAAAEGELAVVLNGEILDTRAKIIGNALYMDIESVNDYLNAGVYWDAKEEISLFTLPSEEIEVRAGDKSYTREGKTISFESEIIVKQGNTAYVLVDYVDDFTAMNYTKIDGDTGRVVMNTVYGEKSYVTASKGFKLRAGESKDYEILKDIKKDEKLTYVSAGKSADWAYVMTSDGISGYAKTADLSAVATEVIASDFKEIVYTSIKKDFDICLGWHQMEFAGGNDSFDKLVKKADCLNVISPTWMKVSNANGGITSLASSAYVKKAHKKNIEVWALVSDFDYDSDGVAYITKVLPETTKRKRLVANIMKEILNCGADGVNVDFEKITAGVSDDYIQFLREMSLECRKAGVVLSVDNYAPTAGTAYYNRKAQGEVVDYCIIMGYDEHWGGGSKAGSVASLPFVENGIINTLKSVPAEKVINAVPFYTRVWTEIPEEMTDGTQEIIEDPIYGNYALSSKAVGLESAINLLKKNGVTKVWLEDLGQYYGEYKEDGKTVRIWLEEDESMTKKLELIDKYKLAGVACWKLGLEYEEIWDVMDKYVE